MKHGQLTLSIWILFFAAAFPLSASSQIRTYHFTWPGNSVDSLFSDSLDVGVIPYARLQYDVWIHNPTDDTLMYWQGSGFLGSCWLYNFDSTGSDLALIVPPHDSGKMTADINPEGGLNNDWTISSVGEISIYHSSQVIGKVWLSFLGRVDFREDDKYPLFQNQILYHGLYTLDSDQVNYDPIPSVNYINDQDSEVTIKTMFIPIRSHFTLLSPKEFPVTLKKNEILTIEYSYSSVPDTIGYIFRNPVDTTTFDTLYNDLVVIITDTTYPVAKANYKGSPPKVNPKSFVFAKTVSPIHDQIVLTSNPVTLSTDITIPNSLSTSIRIFDLLGNKVAEHQGVRWNWNGSSAQGLRLPNGVYTIEAEGISAEGKSIQVSRNIVLLK